MHVVSRRYRWAIYSLLVIVIAAGIVLFFAMAHTARDIRASTTPLLQEKIPTLRHLSDFESALLRYQLTLNKFYVASIGHERFDHLATKAGQTMSDNFEFVRGDLRKTEQMSALCSNYDAVLAVGPALEKIMSAPSANQEQARILLSDSTSKPT